MGTIFSRTKDKSLNPNINNISKKKALLIGINYINTQNELSGCINDATNIHRFLTTNNFFDNNSITLMNDYEDGELYPTKKNILKQFDNLVKFAKKYKTGTVYLFISFSGHGYYVEDTNGDESDGRDEALCPVDSYKSGYITDDTIKSKLVDKLGENVKLVMLVDACHSGTIVDLKYNYSILNTNKNCHIYNKIEDSKCDVIVISGCSDDQTSADGLIIHNSLSKFEYQGAMTAAFLDSYKYGISYVKLIINMSSWLHNYKYTQFPQLSSGKNIDINDTILLCQYLC
jgi:hypothetical protein